MEKWSSWFNVSNNDYLSKNIEGSISIIGDKGSAKVGGIAVMNLNIHFLKTMIKKKLKTNNYQPYSVYGFGHYLYYKNMLDNLIDNKEAICNGKVVYQV